MEIYEIQWDALSVVRWVCTGDSEALNQAFWRGRGTIRSERAFYRR